MILQFVSQRLEYVNLGTKRIHARMTGPYQHDPTIDLRNFTLCGKKGIKDVKPEEAREMDVNRLCISCYNSLRTYSDSFVKAR